MSAVMVARLIVASPLLCLAYIAARDNPWILLAYAWFGAFGFLLTRDGDR